MNLWRYLIKTLGARGFAVVLLGLFSGAANAAVVAWFSRRLANHQTLQSGSLLLPAGCLLVAVLSDLATKAWFIRLTTAATSNLRRDLARQILQYPFDRLERIGTARLLGALTDDVAKVGQTLGNLAAVLIAVVTACGCFLYLALLSPALMAVCLAIGLPVFWGCKTIHRRARRRVREAFQSRDVIFEHFRSLTEGIKELKLNAARQRAFVDELLDLELAAHRNQVAAARLWNQLSVTGSQASILFLLLGMLACANWLPTDAATLTTFAVLLLYAKTAVQAVMHWLPTYSEGETAIANLEAVGFSLVAPPHAQVKLAPSAGPARHVQLDLAGVCFRYETEAASGDTSFTLGPLDLTLQSGEVVLVIGPNGSGKTTLMKLLVGLYAPSAGELRLNGKTIDDHNREMYRQQFSVVFADFYLFERMLGLDADDLPARVSEYLDRLQLIDLVTLTGDGLSTTRLSHGQRQRLALLTAYLEDRPIYVFDEWAANQDPEFRDVFYYQILPELKARGKLVVVISHDDRYFKAADRMVRLTEGVLTPQAQPWAA